uniref:Signal recognition particle subunit SRP72-like n=1 Tax=Crocodylus porosus TaxID=8502 RepID=A0A7M4EFR3_CROPO
MYTNQADQCRKLSGSLQSQSPEHLLPVLIEAAQLCREKQHAKAVELLQDFADQHPANAVEIKLTMAQLKIAQGSITKACIILKSIEELQHKPGMVSALVTMYSHEEDIDSAIEVFTQAIQWYQQFQVSRAGKMACKNLSCLGWLAAGLGPPVPHQLLPSSSTRQQERSALVPVCPCQTLTPSIEAGGLESSASHPCEMLLALGLSQAKGKPAIGRKWQAIYQPFWCLLAYQGCRAGRGQCAEFLLSL